MRETGGRGEKTSGGATGGQARMQEVGHEATMQDGGHEATMLGGAPGGEKVEGTAWRAGVSVAVKKKDSPEPAPVTSDARRQGS